ncbi:MAG TPA: hypothetical protein PLH09_09925, partial [Lentimicrobium sp.]|nr:hypothetical protein [Lentimicrobium sp.]
IEPKKADIEFINWFGQEQIPFTIVFTKADKLSANQLSSNVADFNAKLSETWEKLPSYVITSAETGDGRGALLNLISEGNETFAAFLDNEQTQ